MSSRNEPPAPEAPVKKPETGQWAAPKVVRMRAGDAELGSNPLRPEGPIAVGS